jgi:hypothetical protein
MIAGIPSFHDYVRDKDGKAVGRCIACGFEGPMNNSMTGYEGAKCKSMEVEFTLKDGQKFRQFIRSQHQ